METHGQFILCCGYVHGYDMFILVRLLFCATAMPCAEEDIQNQLERHLPDHGNPDSQCSLGLNPEHGWTMVHNMYVYILILWCGPKVYSCLNVV